MRNAEMQELWAQAKFMGLEGPPHEEEIEAFGRLVAQDCARIALYRAGHDESPGDTRDEICAKYGVAV